MPSTCNPPTRQRDGVPQGAALGTKCPQLWPSSASTAPLGRHPLHCRGQQRLSGVPGTPHSALHHTHQSGVGAAICCANNTSRAVPCIMAAAGSTSGARCCLAHAGQGAGQLWAMQAVPQGRPCHTLHGHLAASPATPQAPARHAYAAPAACQGGQPMSHGCGCWHVRRRPLPPRTR